MFKVEFIVTDFAVCRCRENRERKAGRGSANGRHVELGARTSLIGDPDTLLARVKAFREAGAQHVCAYFGATVEDFVPGMRTFAREVMPGL